MFCVTLVREDPTCPNRSPFAAPCSVKEVETSLASSLFCGEIAQTSHDDRVVELKEQLVVEEVDGEIQEGKVRRE